MSFDLLIRDGTVVDGTGAPAFRADVGIVGDRIAAIGALAAAAASARAVVEAAGRVVAPGFIDVHVHSEIALLGETDDRWAGIGQGVTTNLTAPDGFGWAGLSPGDARAVELSLRSINGPAAGLSFDWPTPEAYLRAFEGRTPVNIAAGVPHLPIRVAVMGWEARRARADQTAAMAKLVRDWMEAGAVGLCTGLDYQPITHSNTDELVALASVAAEYGGTYSAHGRHIEFGRAGAFRETAEVGRRAGLPAHVSHERVDDEIPDLLAEAPEVTSDSHLYEAGSTHLLYNVPWAEQAGGPAGVLERLEDAAYREALAARLETAFAVDPTAMNAWFSASRTGRHIGRSIREIAAEAGRRAGESAVTLLREELPEALLVYPWGPTEAEFRPTVARTLQHPRVMVSSDGVYHGPRPHPRGFGTFPRAIRVGVRELGAVTLEAAINRMTGLPAERYHLADRGRVAVGSAADLVVFDPATFADRATYAEPRLPSVGLDEVIVNGERVMAEGRLTGRTPGRRLARE
ncbi:MAG: amidohydrolase family protein [Chloroflexi bacterium]|nr:amidohydrolase family protein [Chloroflexota bacterium]